jgi:hypothetical protein
MFGLNNGDRTNFMEIPFEVPVFEQVKLVLS